MKRCAGCKQTKNESEFTKNRSTKDGLERRCRECHREYRQQHRERLRKYARDRMREKRQQDPEAVREYKRKYERNRWNTDVQYATTVSLRARLNYAVRKGKKVGSAVHDLGCSIGELLEHLESQIYDERMIRDTYGTVWQIDHIYPLSEADLEDRVQFLAVNNWRNLQPLTIEENLSKNNTVTPEAQLLFDELCDMFRRKEEAA